MQDQAQRGTLFGHPAGLFTLFFAEMWERFSFYGMKALLLYYMMKGFLAYEDSEAYTVLGAYSAMVYMTPFFGGILADRLLGARRSVILGGLLMAAGHLLLTVQQNIAFFTALALLIAGNGFFKPNISTMVGALYPEESPKKDAGFTVFYMGINLGAAAAPLLCGYIGETYGWHFGFGLATIGMLTGLAVFVNWIPPDNIGAPPNAERLRERPVYVSQFLLIAGAVAVAVCLLWFRPSNPFSIAVNVFVAVAMLAALGVASLALRGSEGGLINVEWAVYGAALLSVPVIALLVSGFSPLTTNKRSVSLIPSSLIKGMQAPQLAHTQLSDFREAVQSRNAAAVERLEKRLDALVASQDLSQEPYQELKSTAQLARAERWEQAQTETERLTERFPAARLQAGLAVFFREMSKPAPLMLLLSGLVAFGYLAAEATRMGTVARHRLVVVLVLTMFALLFWSFFEQSTSSVSNFTDRNVDRVFGGYTVTAADVGTTINIQPTQEQLGHRNGDQLFTMDKLTKLRAENEATPAFEIQWTVAEENIGMRLVARDREIPPSVFQSVNSIYILIFGLPFTVLWTFLAARGWEPSTPTKFALALFQLGLGFIAFWYGARSADSNGIVSLGWLLLGYLFLTTGELCLSPVGLAMISRLSPRHLVSTVMGAWFLATALSETFSSIIAQFTGVAHAAGGDEGGIPPPIETVNVYGDVFGIVALTAIGASVVFLLLVPWLKRWMHEEVGAEAENATSSEILAPKTPH
jgi:dipeptide/tripeptide permease